MTVADNGRIAKNTLFLYLRMLVVMAVTFYTARVVLDTLGVDDFGIYNLVGGVVVLFTFLNGSMTTCTQRYLCVAIGKGNPRYERDVFSTSMVAHLLISALFLVLAETAGLWFVMRVLNLPTGSMSASVAVYQLAIATAITNILRVPYNGAIVAYERMSFYAWSSIIETALKLLILVPLLWIPTDKLVLYSLLVLAVNVLILGWYHIFVHRNFPACRTSLQELRRSLLIEMLKFTGWSNFSAFSNLSAKQGMSFILNHFLGVAINAAVGVMNQVTMAIYGFINNFQTAVNPPLIKLFVAEQWHELDRLFVQSAKYSYYLMLLLSLPIIFNIDPILSIWLTTVPEYTGAFCAFSLISLLPNVIGGPIWTIIQASGKISRYQTIIGSLILLNLPLDYLLLLLGAAPYTLLLVAMAVNIAVAVVGAFFVKRSTGISPARMLSAIVAPCLLTTIAGSAVCFGMHRLLPSLQATLPGLFALIAADLLLTLGIVLALGMNGHERRKVASLIKRKILRS